VVLPAQNGGTVSNLAVDAGTVTFNVSWDKNAANMPSVWVDSAWVFVDYNAAGTMKRLPLLPGATLTKTSAPGAGQVIQYSDNDNGVWVVGNAKTASSGSFSATVRLLTTENDVAGACAYASNYPPVGGYKSPTQLAFTGTPVYDIVLKHTDGSTTVTQSGSDFYVPASYTVQTFSDKTGAPGIMKCMPPATYTLQASALAFCAGSVNVQFALSGTEAGRKYQLYQNNSAVGAVLNGTGNAATFTGSFNAAGTYTAQTLADELYCATVMSGTRVIIENPLPANPSVTAGSRYGIGTVALSASSSGAVIDWYNAASGGAALSGGSATNSFTTPSISTSTTYYAQARIVATGCVSAARTAVLATVNCHAPGSTATFAEFSPCATATTGATWTLTDTREAAYNNTQTYKVKKMQDGHIWMVQDLRFGDKCGTKTTFAGSNGANKTNGNYTSLPGTWYGDCRNNTYTGAGYLYDWAAAIQKSGAYKSSNANVGCSGTAGGTAGKNPGACRGICPEGWHIPTGGAAGEFKALYDKYPAGTCVSGNCYCWGPSSAYEGVLAGICSPTGQPEQIGSRLHNYSSTYGTADGAYFLAADHGFQSNEVNETSKWKGMTVRCVMNY
jgi:uncharacterized protein (TIGR02145 family)